MSQTTSEETVKPVEGLITAIPTAPTTSATGLDGLYAGQSTHSHAASPEAATVQSGGQPPALLSAELWYSSAGISDLLQACQLSDPLHAGPLSVLTRMRCQPVNHSHMMPLFKGLPVQTKGEHFATAACSYPCSGPHPWVTHIVTDSSLAQDRRFACTLVLHDCHMLSRLLHRYPDKAGCALLTVFWLFLLVRSICSAAATASVLTFNKAADWCMHENMR